MLWWIRNRFGKGNLVMQLQITETYTDGKLNCGEKYGVVDINPLNLPKILLELSKKVAEDNDGEELVISFPTGDSEVMRVELYNGYRE